MAGIGIVNNPRSRRNLRRPETARRLRALLDGEGEVADAGTPHELIRALERFKRSNVDVLAVNGGDGTGHWVLSAAVELYREAPLPRLALLRGGAMNTVAAAHRLRGSPESILKRLLACRRAGEPFHMVERTLLRVEPDHSAGRSAGGPPRHGFIFGTGAVVRFLDEYYKAGASPLVAARLLARAVGSVLLGGRLARALASPERLRVVASGQAWPEAAYLGVLAGTVPEIGFGFTPFSRCNEQPDAFHAVGVMGRVERLVRAIPALWLGHSWRRGVAVEAVTRELGIETDGPLRYTIDGDLYQGDGSLRIRAGRRVAIIVPDRQAGLW